MKFSLIICTFKRPEALRVLLDSVQEQDPYPYEILVIDSSPDNLTKLALENRQYPKLKYYKVEKEFRGLTKQRNFGISKVLKMNEIVCFLDDDTVLTPTYFKELIGTYATFPETIGVGGYIINDVEWKKGTAAALKEYCYDGWTRKLGSRNELRKKVGLLSDQPPGVMPEFSNGLSISFLPPTEKSYPVEFFMGGVSSYRRELFEKIKFSTYFHGYGLYEDMDFCLRASNFGQLYVNTAAKLYHYHEESGRPNKFNYGKMVIRNGWYVWRIKYPKPEFKARLKWHGIAFLLTLVRMGNIVSTRRKREALTESLGRIVGWCSLLLHSPKINSVSVRKEKV